MGIEWRESLSIGVEEIDSQHKKRWHEKQPPPTPPYQGRGLKIPRLFALKSAYYW
jgi:hypothetical protein